MSKRKGPVALALSRTKPISIMRPSGKKLTQLPPQEDFDTRCLMHSQTNRCRRLGY